MAEPLSIVADVGALLVLSKRVLNSPRAQRSDFKGPDLPLLAEVSMLGELLQILHPLVAGNDIEAPITLQPFLSSCRVTLEAVASSIQVYQTRILTSRISLELDSTLKCLMKDLDRHKATLGIIISSYTSANTSSTKDGIQALHDQVARLQDLNTMQMQTYEAELRETTERANRDRILACISSYNYQARHLDKRDSRTPGTCKWFLMSKDYSDWQAGRGRLMVLEGIPGSGKSVLLSSVIDALLDALQAATPGTPEEGIAYYYINYLERNQQTLSRLTSTLLKQLLQQLQSLPQSIVSLYQWIGVQGRTLDHVTLETQLLEVTAMFHKVYICIDAVDELPEEQQPDLIELVGKLTQHGACVLISSRSSPHLRQQLLNVASEDLKEVRMDASEPQQRHDMELYIRSKLARSRRLKGKDELQRHIVRTLTEKSSGMFLWTSLILEELLQQRTPLAMQKSLQTLPQTLLGVYERMWLEVEDAEENQRLLAESVMALLFLAGQSLPESRVRTILARLPVRNELEIVEWDRETLIESCGGFVMVDYFGEGFCFIHYTVQEFLMDKDIFEGLDRTTMLQQLQDIQIASYVDFEIDDTSSSASWSSTPFSEMSSASSQSSISAQLETVTEQYAGLFAGHKDLRPLIFDCLDKFGIAGFEQTFSALLKKFSKHLQTIAKAPSQQVAALKAGQRTQDIARQTIILSGYLGNVKMLSKRPIEVEKAGKEAILDRYLQLNDQGVVTKDKLSPSQSSQAPGSVTYLPTERPILLGKASSKVPDVDEEEDSGESNVNLQLVRDFLTTTPPFKKLVDELQQGLKPASTLPETTPSKPVPINFSQNLTPSKPWWYSSNIRYFWRCTLRPMLGGEKPLEAGMKRIRWTCVCNRRFYDDFYEIKPGAIQEIQMSIDAIYGQESPSQALQVAESCPSALKKSYSLMKSMWDVKNSLGYGLLIIACFLTFIILILGLRWPSAPATLCAISVLLVSSIIAGAGGLRSQSQSVVPRRRDHVDELAELPLTSSGDNGEGLTSSNQGGQTNQLTTKKEHVKRACSQPAGDIRKATQLASTEPEGNGGAQRLSGDSKDIKDQSGPADKSCGILSRDWLTTAQERDSRSQLWIIACFSNDRDEAKAVHLSVTGGTFDGHLFSRFRKEYFSVRNWWQRFVKLQEVNEIKFVMFGLTAKDIADIRKTDVWPPAEHREVWLYEPCPAKHIPLVGPRYLMNVWRDPHHADRSLYEEWQQHAGLLQRTLEWLRHSPHRFMQRLLGDMALDEDAKLSKSLGNLNRTDTEQPTSQPCSAYIFVKIPKKVGDKVEFDFGDNRPDAYGLLFDERFKVHRLLFYLLLLYFSGSLVVTVWLLKTIGPKGPQSFQGLLWLLGWILTFISLLFTVWFKWAETPR